MLTFSCAARQQNLNLTAEEKRVFYQLFQAADTTNLGVITGEIAVPFFEKTKLSPETLGLVCRAFTLYTVITLKRGVHSNYMFFPTILDMANCRQGKQGAPDPVRVRNRVALDWTRPGWSCANG
jgi:hypothetical protein